jgi:hypothetical protein
MAIQIGKYKRPGIFFEEFDQSVISSPIVEGITNMVIGVSKKGPVNTPVRISTLGELEAIFGSLDRGLERKGSYFHRTIAKMLETSPIFAVNLLATDDNLDKIEYKSLSSASNFKNDVKREGAYRRFFDTTGFWKRDTESFINLTKNNQGYVERAINLTNLSDRHITTFIFKTKVNGFDRTLIEWYGSVEKMPPYLNSSDFASDYMVDVVVVGGDWSNYQELAVDNRWSAYFNASGLRKEKIRDFANDRNVTLLGYYEGLSLIPYFRDANGRNIFIETTINRDTDRTGLFCACNNDLIESDFSNGLIDLLGNGLVGLEEKEIDFLSYKDTIAETISIKTTPLDLPGNVTSILPSYPSNLLTFQGFDGQPTHAFSPIGSAPMTSGKLENGNNRTAWFSEGVVYGVNLEDTIQTNTTTIVEYSVSNDAYVIIGGKYIKVDAISPFIINVGDYTNAPQALKYRSTFVIDQTGQIVIINNLSNNNNPNVNTTDVVLGFVEFEITGGVFTDMVYTDVTVDSNGFVDLSYGSTTNDDYFIYDLQNGSIKIEFIATANKPSVTNYKQYRRFKLFNTLVNVIDNPNRRRMTMLINESMDKRSMENMTITNIVSSTTSNKSFTLNTGLTTAELTHILEGMLIFYTVDNEYIPHESKVETKNEVADTNSGVVAKHSTFYQRYFDGVINTGDYFYSNILLNDVNITLISGEDAMGITSSYAGNDYIIFDSTVDPDLQMGDKIQIPASMRNKGSFTINGILSAANLGFIGANFYAYQVIENVEYEVVINTNIVYNYNIRHYLQMYLDNNNNMFVQFVDSLLQTTEAIDIDYNNTISIISRKSNFKQSIEIEVPNGYVQQPNKILVNASRYTEVKVGDFLEAYVDLENIQNNEVPRRLTRILNKRLYAADTTLVEITCDARISKYNFSGDLQTMRYISIDQYIDSYKAIPLKGFRIRTDSLPDGTEAKQSQILNIVAKGTPLFKAITNKEAIDFRYLIDSFGLGLAERSKQQLMDICGDRLDCFGFLNMPSIRQFKNSTSPSFVNHEGVLQTEFIAKGGDPESNPAFLYSFGDGPGTTCTGYFTPYIMGNDNGRPVELPPAAFVATTYMRKHISNISSITPWTIAAGVTNGKVTNITGLELNFTPEDIEFLNQAQMNPIVFKRNRGHVIETENTAQTLFKSALSFIHVREVLIELERELGRMLLDFQWKFNTPEVRAEIKLRADVICETYVSKNGLYNYFNKIDDENNTPDIIDNQIGVLDTYVEPVKGMGIIVNNVTILRTGAIQSGGFILP